MTAHFEQILSFLKDLDKQITPSIPFELYLIGGAAITLAYDHQNRTADLDLIDPPEILSETGNELSSLARKHRVYISSLAEINFSVPKDWKSKCHLVKLPLKNIRLKVPCVEDLVLGKMARMEPKDFEDIFALAALKILDPEKLLLRLNDNLKKLKNEVYRNNARLLFKEVFHKKLSFSKGKAIV